MMKIDESIIFLKQGDDPLSTLQGGYMLYYYIYVYICNVNESFLQGKRQKVSIP